MIVNLYVFAFSSSPREAWVFVHWFLFCANLGWFCHQSSTLGACARHFGFLFASLGCYFSMLSHIWCTLVPVWCPFTIGAGLVTAENRGENRTEPSLVAL